jgi:hypothetical protein
MRKQPSSVVHLTKRGAAFRLRQLVDEFRLLTASFPDLRDAFDADELPAAFIIRRDSRMTDASGGPGGTFARAAGNAVPRRTPSGARRRAGGRKQMPDG